MVRKTLTAVSVERLKPPIEGRREIADNVTPGLVLRITDKGKKTWSVLYRVEGAGPVNGNGLSSKGKQKRITLGPYPRLDLKSARDKARDVLRSASEGCDPLEGQRERVLRDQLNDFSDVAAEFIHLHAKRSTKKWKITERQFELHVLPKWRTKSLQAVSRGDVHDLLDELAAAKSPAVAREVRKHLSTLFNWAVDRELIPSNPAAGMRRADLRPSQDMGRALSEVELRLIWQAALKLGYPFGDVYRLLILTGQRLREIAEASRTEINEQQRWLEIPRARFKGKRDHIVPFSDTAWTIIDTLPHWSGGPYLFSTRGGTKPIAGFSKAKSRLDKIIEESVSESRRPNDSLAKFRVHDFRVTCESGLAALGVGQEIRDSVLGHAKSGLQRTYNKHDYFNEKRKALEEWTDHVLGAVK